MVQKVAAGRQVTSVYFNLCVCVYVCLFWISDLLKHVKCLAVWYFLLLGYFG